MMRDMPGALASLCGGSSAPRPQATVPVTKASPGSHSGARSRQLEADSDSDSELDLDSG